MLKMEKGRMGKAALISTHLNKKWRLLSGKRQMFPNHFAHPTRRNKVMLQ
jgi:hypothetical protein